MTPGELIAAVAAVVLGAGVIAWLADRAWAPPRCERCGEAAVEADAESPALGAPILVEYRCPTCHRLVDRRYLPSIGD